jgi:hypothetical protein
MATATTSSADPTRPPRPAQPSIRAFLRQHKWIPIAALAVLVVFVAVIVPEIAGAGAWKVTDSTPCSAWSAANPRQQAAYARRYVERHGSLANGATSPAAIEAAINNACIQTFAYDEADTVSVLQAINGQY